MQFPEYLKPVDLALINSGRDYKESQWGSIVNIGIEDLSSVDIALFDVLEDRGSISNQGCLGGGNEVRKAFYSLYKGDYSTNVIDLGTIEAGSSLTDTYFAVQDLMSMLLKENVLPILIGGSVDLVYANYLAYIKQEQIVNLVSIDSGFALGESDEAIHADNYLSKMLLHQPNALFNFSNIGYQTYFVDQKELALLDELFFDIYRLGSIRENIKLAEPIIRNADFVSFNLSSIAHAFAPANKLTSPNGFSAEQACQLCRYAGMNDKLTAIGFYEFNPSLKDHGSTAKLLAQMVWYFIDGFYNRKGDFPIANKNEYTKYNISHTNQNLVFYKSSKTDRWWMEIPYPSSSFKKYEKHLMLPCNYEEYLTASANEIPERWFQTFKKLK